MQRIRSPGSFADLEDLNAQLAAWQAEIADVRVYGTTHQLPIERFADEAGALIAFAGRRSFLQAMVRERKVASPARWLRRMPNGRPNGLPRGRAGWRIR